VTLRHPAVMKGLYWATGSLLAAQLIYFFNDQLGWLHVAYFLTNLVLTDLFSFDYRSHELETGILLSYIIIGCGLITGMISSQLTLYVLLIPAAIYNIWLAVRGYKVFSHPEYWIHISERNKAIANKQSGFMKIFFSLIGIISFAGVIMGLIN